MSLRARIGEWIAGRPQAQVISTSRDLAKRLEEENLTIAGVAITPTTALQLTAVACAVGIIAETCAQLPFPVYKRLKRGKERVPEHPIARLLGEQPNQWQNAFEFREMMTAHLAAWGNCYAFKLYVGNEVRELLPIHPNRVRVEQDADFRVTYTITLPGGEQIVRTRSTIFHIRDRGLQGYVGDSRVVEAAQALGLSVRLEQYGAQLFGNGARPSGILSTDKPLKPDQMTQIRESWKAAHGGSKSGGTAVVDNGLTWTSIAMNSVDSEYLSHRKMQIAEASRIWRVPPHMLGDLERATFSNIEHQALQFVTYCLLPWLKRWEMAVRTQLLADDREHFAEHLVDGLYRGDIKTRYDAYKTGISIAVLSPNECREMENRNPYEGGDDFRAAANLFGDQGEEKDDEAKA